MLNNQKYSKVTGYWVYGHITPDYHIYIGRSGGKNGIKQCCQRWHPSHYRSTALQPYIDKFGWENIRHIVFMDNLTQKQSELLECFLITQAKNDGWCINDRNSGGQSRDNMKEYNKQYYEKNKDRIKENSNQYRKEHIKERREYDRQRNQQPERKVYIRVKNYNNYHPDRKLITPAEAKEMYELTGYIPDFIKNDDLK